MRPLNQWPAPWRWCLCVLGVALVYLLSGALGLWLSPPQYWATPVFPAAGWALAATLWLGPRALLGVGLGASALWWLTSAPHSTWGAAWIGAAPLLALGSVAQAASGAWLVRRRLGLRWRHLDNERDVLALIGWGGWVAGLVAPIWGLCVWRLLDLVPSQAALPNWLTWQVGDLLGITLVTPLVLTLLSQRRRRWSVAQHWWTLPMLAALLAVMAMFYGVERWATERRDMRLHEDLERAIALTRDHLQHIQSTVGTLRSLAEASPQLDARHFRRFAQQSLADNPDVALLALHARPPDPGPGGVGPWTLRYQAWAAPHRPAPGVPQLDDTAWAATAQAAWARGDVALSDPVSGPGGSWLWWVYPVEAPSDAPAGARFSGVASGLLPLSAVMERLVRPTLPRGLVVQLRDADPMGSLLYRSDGETQALEQPQVALAMPLPLANRTWLLEASHGPDQLHQELLWLPWTMGMTAALFASLLQALLLGAAGRSDAIELQHQELKHSEQRYLQLFDESPLAAWVYDARTLRFLMVNAAAVQRYGWPRAAFERMTLGDLMAPGTLTEHLRARQDQPDQALHLSGEHRRQDGSTVAVRVHSSPTPWGDHAAVLEVIEDIRSEIAQREELEQRVAARTAQLSQALHSAHEAGRAKTAFLGRVSHDLRSPLTAIMGYAQLLHLQGGPAAEPGGIILRSAERMLQLINDLIEYARSASSDEFAPAPLYIHGLIDAVAQEALDLAERQGNRFHLTIDEGLPNVLVADGPHLRELLLQLLDNAAKFTQNGDMGLAVQVSPTPASQGPDEPLPVVFRVWDSGCGMPSQVQGEAFAPLVRGDDAALHTDGSGLGLSIVESWVKRMGGGIDLRSAPNQGTEVLVTLPMRVGSEQDLAQPQLLVPTDNDLPTLDGAGRRVWVVEDTREIRALLVDVLERTGFVVSSASDGQAFIDQLHTPGTPRASLVLTDYLMPRADGAAVLRAVRSHWPGVPVVLLSATQKTMESLAGRVQHDFDASLTKPIHLGNLRRVLAQLLSAPADAPAPSPDAAAAPLGPVSTPNAPDALNTPKPPPEAMAQLRLWVDMGALTDLQDWADQWATQDPNSRPFTDQVRSLAQRGDLNALQALC